MASPSSWDTPLRSSLCRNSRFFKVPGLAGFAATTVFFSILRGIKANCGGDASSDSGRSCTTMSELASSVAGLSIEEEESDVREDVVAESNALSIAFVSCCWLSARSDLATFARPSDGSRDSIPGGIGVSTLSSDGDRLPSDGSLPGSSPSTESPGHPAVRERECYSADRSGPVLAPPRQSP